MKPYWKILFSRRHKVMISDAQPVVYQYANLSFVNLKKTTFKKGAAVEHS